MAAFGASASLNLGFSAGSSQPGGFAGTFNFRITLNRSDGSSPPLGDGGFQECNGLQIEMDVQELQEGGRNDGVVKQVGRGKYTSIVLKRGMLLNSIPRFSTMLVYLPRPTCFTTPSLRPPSWSSWTSISICNPLHSWNPPSPSGGELPSLRFNVMRKLKVPANPPWERPLPPPAPPPKPKLSDADALNAAISFLPPSTRSRHRVRCSAR